STMCIRYEQYFLDRWKPEYNIRKIAENNLGIKRPPVSDATRRKLSRALKGRSTKTWSKGQKVGFKHTDETKKKISLSKKGKPSPFKGKKHSEESKRKISEARKLAKR
ncbi:hypothetical protein LCGC14_0738340, partial [marine sediment metagenome]